MVLEELGGTAPWPNGLKPKAAKALLLTRAESDARRKRPAASTFDLEVETWNDHVDLVGPMHSNLPSFCEHVMGRIAGKARRINSQDAPT